MLRILCSMKPSSTRPTVGNLNSIPHLLGCGIIKKSFIYTIVHLLNIMKHAQQSFFGQILWAPTTRWCCIVFSPLGSIILFVTYFKASTSSRKCWMFFCHIPQLVHPIFLFGQSAITLFEALAPSFYQLVIRKQCFTNCYTIT